MANRRKKTPTAADEAQQIKPAEDLTLADLLKQQALGEPQTEDQIAARQLLAEAAGTAHALRDMGNSFADIYKAMQPEIEKIRQAAIKAATAAAEIVADGRRAQDFMKEIMPGIFELAREMAELEPYLQEELKKPEYGGRTFDELLADTEGEDGKPSPGLPEGSLARKALDAAQTARAAAEGVEQIPALLTGDYGPMLNNKQFNELVRLSKRDFEQEKNRAAAFYDGDNVTFTINNFNEMQGGFSVSAKKILHAAIMGLSQNNYYKANRDRVNPTVLLPLNDYAEACGYNLEPQKMSTPEEQEAENKRAKNRAKELKKAINKDLHDISNVTWSASIKRGNGAGDYKQVRIISSSSVMRGIIRINFDIETAAFLVKSYVMHFPLALLRIDNRNPNAYSIGYKIALHSSIDNNYSSGTNCTLSVKKLLDAAEQIPTKEELDRNKQRNWKDKIKKPLEASLDALIQVGQLKRWEYRDTKTGKTYTPAQANRLIWEQYISLMVDWTLEKDPEQDERRARRAAEAEQARLEENHSRKSTPLKKRGSGKGKVSGKREVKNKKGGS